MQVHVTADGKYVYIRMRVCDHTSVVFICSVNIYIYVNMLDCMILQSQTLIYVMIKIFSYIWRSLLHTAPTILYIHICERKTENKSSSVKSSGTYGGA